MGRIYTVGSKQIDVEDAEAVRALNDEEVKTLLRLTLQSKDEPGDTGPVWPVRQPPAGTAFVMFRPPKRSTDD